MASRNYLILFILIYIAPNTFSQRNYSNSSSKIIVRGTSNLHNWNLLTNKSKVNMVMTIDSGQLKSIQYLSIEIPVKSLKSSEGKVMDNNTYKSLNAEKFPNIVYKLEKVNRVTKNGDKYILSTIGTLSIAGVTKKIKITAMVVIKSDGTIDFKVQKKIKMSYFNLKLPSSLLGWIKTGDEFYIMFDLIVKQT